MAKPKRTEAELIALLNAALRRADVCDSVTVAAIYQVEDKTANWDADARVRRARAARLQARLYRCEIRFAIEVRSAGV